MTSVIATLVISVSCNPFGALPGEAYFVSGNGPNVNLKIAAICSEDGVLQFDTNGNPLIGKNRLDFGTLSNRAAHALFQNIGSSFSVVDVLFSVSSNQFKSLKNCKIIDGSSMANGQKINMTYTKNVPEMSPRQGFLAQSHVITIGGRPYLLGYWSNTHWPSSDIQLWVQTSQKKKIGSVDLVSGKKNGASFYLGMVNPNRDGSNSQFPYKPYRPDTAIYISLPWNADSKNYDVIAKDRNGRILSRDTDYFNYLNGSKGMAIAFFDPRSKPTDPAPKIAQISLYHVETETIKFSHVKIANKAIQSYNKRFWKGIYANA